MADKVNLPDSYKVLLGEARNAKADNSQVQLRTYLGTIEQLGKDIERAILKARVTDKKGENTMAEWSPEDVREGILISLYKAYMQDCRRPIVFNKEALGKDDPPFNDVYREVKQLEHWGWLVICGGMTGAVLCRLTPEGRDVFEKMLGEEVELKSRAPIGYEGE